LDITNTIDNLFLDKALEADALDVRIVPNQAVPESEEITVGRVSVYRQGRR
jgi:tyrosinase